MSAPGRRSPRVGDYARFHPGALRLYGVELPVARNTVEVVFAAGREPDVGPGHEAGDGARHEVLVGVVHAPYPGRHVHCEPARSSSLSSLSAMVIPALMV